jgi:hypothetical protein
MAAGATVVGKRASSLASLLTSSALAETRLRFMACATMDAEVGCIDFLAAAAAAVAVVADLGANALVLA